MLDANGDPRTALPQGLSYSVAKSMRDVGAWIEHRMVDVYAKQHRSPYGGALAPESGNRCCLARIPLRFIRAAAHWFVIRVAVLT